MKTTLLSVCFTAGCLGGLVSILALWGITETTSNWPFLIKLHLEDCYPPILWSGVWGLMLAFPSSMKLEARAMVFSFFPALTHLAIKNGWLLSGGLGGFDMGEFLSTYTLVYAAVYFVCWSATCILFLRWR